jgi:hypothetical protein
MDAPLTAYLTRFSALAPDVLPDDAAERLRTALEAMPGMGAVHGATHDHGARTVSGEFLIEVEHGIASAARDGSRFAKEALKGAGLGDAQLVELWVALRGDLP